MRWVIAGLIGVWCVLTAGAYLIVLPDRRDDADLIHAYFAVGPDDPGPAGRLVARFLDENRSVRAAPQDVTDFAGADRARREHIENLFRSWYQFTQGRPLSQSPRLTWSTDDNPARRVQCGLFRAWHLRRYGEPLDIRTDPSNRDTTKTVVQCVAGAGPDIIETYGPAQLSQFIDAGVALDVTDRAQAAGFAVDRVFPAAVSSVARDGRQYAFPCNVGYLVLFYHRDLFKAAGVGEPPAGGWTIEQLTATARRITGNSPGDRRLIGIMGMGAWEMALAAGGRFFNDDATACTYNSPRTVAALSAYLDLMYRDRVMPTPAELASMAASGGANMNATAESASASALFAAKATAMVVDGRWSYVPLAARQRDRVLKPAMERRIALLAQRAQGAAEATLLRAAIDSLDRDVLVPLSDAQFAAMESCLTGDDRRALVQIGVAHVPSLTGTPFYESAARVAIVNRASPRADLAVRFLEFLASPEYNRQINYTFDSISGVPAVCAEGIAGPPRALPGLEAFDSPTFVEAMEKYAHPWELSPFIGRARLGQLVGPVLEQLTSRAIGPAEAARVIEDRINDQMHANLVRDEDLRREWERRAGSTFDPARPLREQVEVPPPARSGS